MDLLTKNRANDKASQEQVQKQKQEYYLLGTYLRTKGLKVFCHNPQSDEVSEVEIRYSDTIHILPTNGELIPVDYEHQKCQIDSRFNYFEALNIKTALNRLKNYKSGRIKELCNLRKFDEKATIKLF